MPRGDRHVQADHGRGHRVRCWPRDAPQLAHQVSGGQPNGGTETDLTVTERARLKELEREVQELRAETPCTFPFKQPEPVFTSETCTSPRETGKSP